MKLPFELNKDTITLCIVAFIMLTFFMSAAFDVLDNHIIKLVLFSVTGGLALVIFIILFYKNIIKNRLEEDLQDDSN